MSGHYVPGHSSACILASRRCGIRRIIGGIPQHINPFEGVWASVGTDVNPLSDGGCSVGNDFINDDVVTARQESVSPRGHGFYNQFTTYV